MTLRTVIVDDERIARQRLRRLLKDEPEIEVSGECADGFAAIKLVGEICPDLLFLDVQMPKMDAFCVLKEIGPEGDCAVIFVTAFDKHAVHAFDTCAIDYLLKPITPERLRKAISRAREHLKLKKPTVAPSQSRRFAVRSGQTTTFVGPKEIDWIEADGNYAILHVGPRNHLLRQTMATLEAELSPEEFLRVGRSAIVRIEEVKEIHALPNNRHAAVLKTNALVPITCRIREIENKLRLKSKRATD